jgi:outer membrane protein OmpA-like peptidoglycan-associated protein
MILSKEKIMKILLLALLVASCSSKPAKDQKANSPTVKKAQETKAVSMESKQLASEEESNLVTEITFPKEKATISKQAQEEIRALYKKASGKGKIDEIKVITWGDQEYPSVYEKKLSEKQINLVEKRNDAIEKYLGTLNKNTDVETYSMAERPGTLKKLFSSEDAKIKKSLETAGIPNTDTTVKVPGKASKSVVIFIMDEG